MSRYDEALAQHTGLIRFVLARLYLRHCSSLLDYEDAFQYGAMGLMHAVDTYDPERGAFSTWATVCIRRYVLDGYRALMPHRTDRPTITSLDEQLEINGWRPAVPDWSEATATTVDIRRAVAQLPPKQGYVVWEHYIGDRKIRSLYRRLGVSEGRVSQLRQAGIKRLAGMLRVTDVVQP